MPEFHSDKHNKELQLLIDKVERMLSQDGPIYFMQEEEFFDVYQYYRTLEDESRINQLIDIALQVHPLSEDFLLEKINLLIAQQRFVEAEEVVDGALQHFPTDFSFLKEKLNIAIELNKVKTCLAALEYAIHVNSNYFPLLYLLGKCYAELEAFDDAINATAEALEQYDEWRKSEYNQEYEGDDEEEADPTIEYLFFGGSFALIETLSDYCLEIGNDETCVALLEKMIDKAPYDVERWLRLGFFHKCNDNYSEAIKCFEYGEAANLGGEYDYLDLSFLLGECLIHEERYEEALQVFGEMWEKGSRSMDTAYFNGYCLEKLEGYDKAIGYYKKALEYGPKMPQANLRLGLCLIQQEKWMQATHFLKVAADAFPHEEQYDALIALAEAEYQLGNFVSASEAFDEASALGAEHASLWLKWSFMYYEQKELSEAINIILEGIEILPDNPELMYRATAYFLAAGKPVQATEYLQFALVIDYEKHHVLYDFFQDITMQKTLAKLINKFKD